MPDRFPRVTTRWVFSGTNWQPGGTTAEVAHFTNATIFVNNGRLIDGRANGLSKEDFEALKARFPDDLVEEKPGEFTLPFVPVGTVVDITPLSDGAPPANQSTDSTGAGQRRKTPKGG